VPIKPRLLGFRNFLILACCPLVLFMGCGQRPDRIQTEPVEAPPVIEHVVETPTPGPTSEPTPEPATTPPAPVNVTVLLSDDLPHYQSVRDEVVRLAGEEYVTSYSLSGSEARAMELEADLQRAENVLAVGLVASKVAERLGDAKAVFCQVFNYQENGLPGSHMRGIEMLPDLGKAAEVWTRLDPDLERVGVITGPGQARRLERAATQLRAHGIELVYRVTNSDKETLLEFQRLAEEIDGYWMFPDNRVLSSSTIREIMERAKRSRIGVLANDPGFHQIGAVICAANEPGEIAAEAWTIFEESRDEIRFSKTSLEPLSRASVTVNRDVAVQLGYSTEGLSEDLLAR
jgi:ABC-type uncharacterized transport system substrate-binding protein